jgi:hypothetical protein
VKLLAFPRPCCGKVLDKEVLAEQHSRAGGGGRMRQRGERSLLPPFVFIRLTCQFAPP